MNEGFRGHVEECIKHLAARLLETHPKGSKSSTEGKRPIAEFCGVNIHTVTSWFFRASNLPRGEQYIKLLCFLDLNGYKVIEFERMPTKCKNFAKLIGFGLIKSEDAAEMLGYSQVSELFRVLRGDTGLTSEKEEKIWELWKARKDKLDTAIEEACEHYLVNRPCVPTPRSTEAKSIADEKPPLTKTVEVRNVMQGLVARDGVLDLMQGLLKLLDSGILQDMTQAEKLSLRGSSSVILRLSSHLSRLSAELVKPS